MRETSEASRGRLTTIERADRVFVLDHGRIVRQGTFAEVRAGQPDLAARVA